MEEREVKDREKLDDLRGLDISWERAEELAMVRVEWRRCVSLCPILRLARDGLM